MPMNHNNTTLTVSTNTNECAGSHLYGHIMITPKDRDGGGWRWVGARDATHFEPQVCFFFLFHFYTSTNTQDTLFEVSWRLGIIPLPSTLAKKTTNKSFRLVGGFPSPSTLDLAQNDHQRVIMTRWCPSTLVPGQKRPPTRAAHRTVP